MFVCAMGAVLIHWSRDPGRGTTGVYENVSVYRE